MELVFCPTDILSSSNHTTHLFNESRGIGRIYFPDWGAAGCTSDLREGLSVTSYCGIVLAWVLVGLTTLLFSYADVK